MVGHLRHHHHDTHGEDRVTIERFAAVATAHAAALAPRIACLDIRPDVLHPRVTADTGGAT